MTPIRRDGAADPDGSKRGRTRNVVVVGALGAVLAVLAGIWLYQEKWPPTVDDREIARIGIPLSGSQPIGHPHTTSGSVLCIDACLVRARAYRAVGPLGNLADDARRHLHDRGYAAQTELVCSQTGPLGRTPAPYWLFCSFSARRSKFSATITFNSYSTTAFGVPSRPNSSGAVQVSVPPLSVAAAASQSVSVAVSY